MSDKRVVKICPSWELTNEDDKGNMFFEFTDEPRGYISEGVMQRKEAASKKIMRELENRRKLWLIILSPNYPMMDND